MITPLRKTIARSIVVLVNDDTEQKWVIYLQPNGQIVFRRHRGRKRYMLNLGTAVDRAQKGGPVTGLFELLLDGKSKRKESLPMAKKKRPASKKKSAKAVKAAERKQAAA